MASNEPKKMKFECHVEEAIRLRELMAKRVIDLGTLREIAPLGRGEASDLDECHKIFMVCHTFADHGINGALPLVIQAFPLLLAKLTEADKIMTHLAQMKVIDVEKFNDVWLMIGQIRKQMEVMCDE